MIQYLTVATPLLFAASMVALIYYDGKKQGAFYAKGKKKIHPKLKKAVSNIHSIQSPLSVAVFLVGITSFLGMALALEISLIKSTILAIIYSNGIMTIGDYYFQVWVNRSVGLPDVDPDEKKTHEVYFSKAGTWIPKIWAGERRGYQRFAGGAMVLFALILLFQ